jgi:hypothetical protein
MVVFIWLVTPVTKRVSFLERSPAQALDHLKRNILSISWNGFSIVACSPWDRRSRSRRPTARCLVGTYLPAFRRLDRRTGRLRALAVRSISGSDGRSRDRPGGMEGPASLPPAGPTWQLLRLPECLLSSWTRILGQARLSVISRVLRPSETRDISRLQERSEEPKES